MKKNIYVLDLRGNESKMQCIEIDMHQIGLAISQAKEAKDSIDIHCHPNTQKYWSDVYDRMNLLIN